MPPNSFEKSIAKQFRLQEVPTLLAHRDAAVPIAFSGLRVDDTFRGTTLPIRTDEAFTFQVALGPMPAGDIWIGAVA